MTDKHGTSVLVDEGTSALVELAEEISLLAAEGEPEFIEGAALTADDLKVYYEEIERVVEAQQVAEDDATQLFLR